MSLLNVLKHLPGKHNQKLHARSGERNLPNGLKFVESTRHITTGGFFITPDDRIIDLQGYRSPNGEGYWSHDRIVSDLAGDPRFQKAMSLTSDDLNAIADTDYASDVAVKRGAIRAVIENGGALDFQTNAVDTPTLRRLQKMADAGKLVMKPGAINYWENLSASGFVDRGLEFSSEEFLSASTVGRRRGELSLKSSDLSK